MLAALALLSIIIGALILGIAIGRAIQSRKDIDMSNSAALLTAAAADAAASVKAITDENASLTSQVASLTIELDATKADLAADEQAIADSIAVLPKSTPNPAPAA